MFSSFILSFWILVCSVVSLAVNCDISSACVTTNTPVWTWVFHSGWPWCTDHSQGRQSYCGRTPLDVSAHSRVQWHHPQIYSGSTVESTSDQLLRRQRKNEGYENGRTLAEGYISLKVSLFLTVTFGSVFQTECYGQHGIIFKKLCSKCIPPQVITLLNEKGKIISYLHFLWIAFICVYSLQLCAFMNLCPVL